MSVKIEGGARFDTWLPAEEKCTSATFEKINQRLSWYIQETKEWGKAKFQKLFSELAEDLDFLENCLVGRVAAMTGTEDAELAPLIQKTRDLFQELNSEENLKYYNYHLSSYDSARHGQGYSYRRKINELQLHFFTKDGDCVRYYAERLSGYPEKLKLWNKRPDAFEEFSNDLCAYEKCLFGRVAKLAPEQIDPLKSVLSVAVAALQKIKTDKTISENLAYYQKYLGTYNPSLSKDLFDAVKAVSQVSGFLEAQTGASLGLYRIFQLIKLFENPRERILVMRCDGVDVALAETAGGSEQERVKEYLEGIHLSLLENSTVKHLSTLQLLKMKIAAGWMMANYEKHMASGIDLTEAIFDALVKINSAINQRIGERGDEAAAEISGNVSLKASLIRLQNYFRENTYFRQFWIEQKHVAKLSKHAESVQDYIALLAKKQLSADGLTFITADEDVGLRIYEKDGEVFVFCSGTEKSKDYWNILQERNIGVLAGGVGHKPVMDKADQALVAMNELVERTGVDESIEWDKVKVVNFSGFGLDGAVAQLLAYNFANKNKGKEIHAYCLGTPAYLDRNSAAKIAGCDNLYSINFALVGDRALKTNYTLLRPVQKKWSSASFITYPLYNSDWFVSDWSGHWDENYLANAESAMKFPIRLHEMHQEVDLLLHPENKV